MSIQGLERAKVVRVDRYEFELNDGSVYRHPEPLDTDFTVQEFQVIYDRCYNSVLELLDEPKIDNSSSCGEEIGCECQDSETMGTGRQN